MVKVEGLTFHYARKENILEDIHFTIGRGSFLAILGNNGVGKSTLLKCLNGILKPTQGQFHIEGRSVYSLTYRERARLMAFVSQNLPETKMTVHDVVMMGRRPYMKWHFTGRDHEIIHQSLRRLQIENLKGRYLNQLSGGERQKVMLARALAQEPQVLLLDEPTSSLDIRNQYEVLRLVRNFCQSDGLTAIMVIHDINLALRFCDHFLLLQEGRVYDFGDHHIITSKALGDIYGIQASLNEVGGKRFVLVESSPSSPRA
ncbi:MAG: ABC transporter ATP-binding protein [Firmicutes bacterium]|nr:ABC transporter ATP-binding protein [Bacillota bacterium]